MGEDFIFALVLGVCVMAWWITVNFSVIAIVWAFYAYADRFSQDGIRSKFIYLATNALFATYIFFGLRVVIFMEEHNRVLHDPRWDLLIILYCNGITTPLLGLAFVNALWRRRHLRGNVCE